MPTTATMAAKTASNARSRAVRPDMMNSKEAGTSANRAETTTCPLAAQADRPPDPRVVPRTVTIS